MFPNSHFVKAVLLLTVLTFTGEKSHAQESSAPVSATDATENKDGFSVLAMLQGMGAQVGTGFGIRTPRIADAVSLRLGIMSNNNSERVVATTNQEVYWEEAVLDFTLYPRLVRKSEFSPYISLGLTRAFQVQPASVDNSMGISSLGYRIGFENRLDVFPLWGEQKPFRELFFMEAGPEYSTLRDPSGFKLNNGFLVRTGLGVTF